MPEEKIVPRYKRTMEQLFNACLLVNRAYIFDNSLNDYYMVAEVHETELIVHNDNLAAQLSWHKIHLINKFNFDDFILEPEPNNPSLTKLKWI